MITGTFRSSADEPGADTVALLDRRTRVTAPQIGENLVYWQLNRGADKTVYRQRLLQLDYDAERKLVVQTTWSFRSPEAYIDAFDDPKKFQALTTQDLVDTLPPQCAQLWTKKQRLWLGKVSPGNCRIWSERRTAWRRIGAEVVLSENQLLQAERGFDDAGNQVWGTPPGEFTRLQRD